MYKKCLTYTYCVGVNNDVDLEDVNIFENDMYTLMFLPQINRPKAVLWQNTPGFIDIFITYAKFANHGVKMVNSQKH